MTNRFDNDSETLALLRQADPLNDRRVEADTDLDNDLALRIVLDAIERESSWGRGTARRRGFPRRHPMRLGFAVAGVVAVAVAIFGISSSGQDEISMALRSSGVGVATAQARIIARAEQAIAAPQGSIIETEASLTKTGPDGTSLTLQDHTWSDNQAPYSRRSVESYDDLGSVETGAVGDRRQIYDPSTDTVYIDDPQPLLLREVETIPSVQDRATELLHEPGVKVDPDATLDGAPAIRITAETDGEISEYWVSPTDYSPLQYVDRIAGSAGQTTITYGLYRTLEGEESRPLLSVLEQHPSANVVHGEPAFHAAELRIYAKAEGPGGDGEGRP